MSVGNLEEIIDDNHAIVSTSVGSEHYVSILSFVDKDQLEPGCSVLLNHKVHAVVGVLSDDTDPMVAVMKLEKAPTESYADIGGLDTQIQVNLTFSNLRTAIESTFTSCIRFTGDQGVCGASPHPPRVLRGDGDQASQGGEIYIRLYC